MKPKTEAQKEAVLINRTLDEDISIADRNTIIGMIEKDKERSKYDTIVYFSISESAYPDWEVIRLYQMHIFHNKTGVKYYCVEVLRNFKKDRHNLMFGKLRGMNGCISYTSDIELRANRKSYYYGYTADCLGDLFKAEAYRIERTSVERIKCLREDPKDLNKVIAIPYGETLYNQGELRIIHYTKCYNYKKEFLDSIRIAKKHGLEFAQMCNHEWFDMVYCIIKTKNDNHNPKFVAPENINMMHNYFLEKYQALQRKKEREREERDMFKREREQLVRLESERKINEAYIKRRKKYFDLDISNSKFDIHILKNVQEFYEEGTEMHHCVFSMGYYKKEKSLIMSCRDKQGNRVETIEVDLNTYKIAQCYGKYDQFTEWHDEIIKLVEQNMNKIRLCRQRRGKVKNNNLQIAI